jgi:hypothetical protein
MASKSLIEKIEELPAEKKAEVEAFVEFLARRGGISAGSVAPRAKRFPDRILERMNERRERLFKEHGYFDSIPILRDLRENGPR